MFCRVASLSLSCFGGCFRVPVPGPLERGAGERESVALACGIPFGVRGAGLYPGGPDTSSAWLGFFSAGYLCALLPLLDVSGSHATMYVRPCLSGDG